MELNIKKNILILSSWYPNRIAPFLGNFVQRQAEVLSEKFNVTVLYTCADSEVETTEWSIAERANLKEIVIYHPKGTNFLSRRRAQDKAFEEGLKEIKDVDIIHAHVFLPKGYLFVRAKKMFNCPLVITEHGSYFRPEKRKRWTLKEKFILKTTKKHIDQIISVSDFLKTDLQDYFEQQAIVTIPNSINTALFKPGKKKQSTKIQFLHISTLDNEVKNPQGIIEAISLLSNKGYDNFHVTIISDEDSAEIANYAIHQKVSQFISFLGPFSPNELVHFYQNSDAFVLFSIYETFSIVLAEAWACGIPTITTPVGIGYNLSHDLGLQVKINDPLSLAMAMEKIINGLTFDSELIREKALEFSDENILNQLTELYERLNG